MRDLTDRHGDVSPSSRVSRRKIFSSHLPALVFVNLPAKLDRVFASDAVDLV